MKSITTSTFLVVIALVTASSHAAITVNDLSGVPSLTATSGPVYLSIDPLFTNGGRGLEARYDGSTFVIEEEGFDGVSVGSMTVNVGTDLRLLADVGTVLYFAASEESGRYYATFRQPHVGAVGYLTFDYDKPSETITFVSSTVQDEFGQPLVVIPEPSMALLGGLASLLLLRRRR